MNILEIMQKFPTQEACLEHLERVRWGSQPRCVYCESDNVGRHPSGDRKMARWQCFACKKAFSVTVGTIFHGTHMPLRDWFLVLSLMISAKKSASAYQISRDLGIRRPTVWSMMHRARAAMKTDQGELLHGVVEMDETYVGGKPRKTRTKKTIQKGDGFGGGPNGTLKMPVIGAVERNGRVVAAPADNAQHTSLLAFFRKHVDPEASILLTDEYAGYRSMHKYVRHTWVNHSLEYSAGDGFTHTNTIEGFWALVKRAWYGSHHHYSLKYAPVYIAESCFKYNVRRDTNAFGRLLNLMVGV